MTLAAGGRQALSDLRTMVRSETDTENDPNITDAELTSFINMSRLGMYNYLIKSFGDDYYTASAQLTTDGVLQAFPLPDGTLYSAAPAFYKGALVEAISGGSITANFPVTLQPFNFREKNRYQQSMSVSALPSLLPRYRIMGATGATNPTTVGTIFFNILPASGLVVRLWYAPKLTPLSDAADIADDFGGYLEHVVVDASIKVAQKQERAELLQTLGARKAELKQEIIEAVANRNIGDPNTVVETDGDSGPFGITDGYGFWS